MIRACMLGHPAAGHVNPTLPVIAALARRGHQITYFATPPFEARIRHAGAAFESYGAHELVRTRAVTWRHARRHGRPGADGRGDPAGRAAARAQHCAPIISCSRRIRCAAILSLRRSPYRR